MAETTTETTTYYREPRGILALWFAVLAGPLAWMLGLSAEYSLVRVACEDGNMLPLHLVSLATLLLAAGGGLVSWREWRRSGEKWPSLEGGTMPRSRFMVALGLLGSPLFALTILAQWVAVFAFHPCMGI